MIRKNKKRRVLRLNKKAILADNDESDQCKQIGNESTTQNTIFQIEEHIFCSGYKIANDRDILKSHNISHIINLTAHKYPNLNTDLVTFSSFNFSDDENFDLTIRLKPVLQILNDKIIEKKNVLIHCQKGISRAPSVIMAFLIKHRNMTFEESLKVVRAKNPKAYPNLGFLFQLKAL